MVEPVSCLSLLFVLHLTILYISKVFGRKYQSVYRPQRIEQLSVAQTWAGQA